MALEEFLKQVKETWQTYELEMVNYQNKCRLIRGWDDLFNKVLLSSQYYMQAWLYEEFNHRLHGQNGICI